MSKLTAVVIVVLLVAVVALATLYWQVSTKPLTISQASFNYTATNATLSYNINGTHVTAVAKGVQLQERLFDLQQVNLTSSVPGIAPNLDTNLTDAWGVQFGDPLRVWVNAQSGYSTAYYGNGTVYMIQANPTSNTLVPLRVLVPGAPNVSGPAPLTGLAFIPGHSPSGPFLGDAFIFVSEDGVIAGWHPDANGTVPMNATIRVDNYVNNDEGGSYAVYKGVAAVNTSGGWFLYVTDFGQSKIQVYNSTYGLVNTTGKFVDPNMPSDFSPFNIYYNNRLLYVSYAKLSIDKQNDVKGLGNGYIDVYYLNGTLDKRLVSGGLLNSPWGMALAPSDYGNLSNMLLVGNFGDGHINVYNPSNGTYEGTIGENGVPLQIDDLWGITFGTGNGAGATNQLFFAAGESAESQGVFGKLDNPQLNQT